MDLGVRLTQSKQYSSTSNFNTNTNLTTSQYQSSSALLHLSTNNTSNSNSNNVKLPNTNQRLDQIRRKYDTPTRKQLKQIQVKSINEKPISKDMELRKSINSGFGDTTLRQRWNTNSNPNGNASNASQQVLKSYDYSPAAKYHKQNMNTQQQTIFRKIKQMKDTLLQKNTQSNSTNHNQSYNNYTSNYNDKIRTTKSIYEHRLPVQNSVPDKIQVRPQMIDHRLQNIDRINAKFQQILNCLRESEGKISTGQLQARQKDKQRQRLSQKIQYKQSTKYPQNNLLKTQIPNHSSSHAQFSSTSFSQSQPNQVYETKPMKNYQSKSIADKNNMNSSGIMNKNKIQVKNTYSIYQQKQQRKKVFSPSVQNSQFLRGDSKVRSFISTIQRQTGKSKSNFYQMKSGKKLDDQINKIQSKIQQFQEQKRKLNIDFKPYSHSTSKSTTNLTKRSYTIDKYQKVNKKSQLLSTANQNLKKSTESYDPAPIGGRKTIGGQMYYQKKYQSKERQVLARFNTEQSKQRNIQRTNINIQIQKKMERQLQKQAKNQNLQNSIFKIKLMPVQSAGNNTTNNNKKSTNSSRIQSRMLSQDLRKKTDEGILDRKKKLTAQSGNPKAKVNTKKLVQKLSSQANMDQKFRNNKLYFESNINVKKWEQLETALKKNGYTLQKAKIQKTFKVTDQQNNPFFSSRESSNNMQDLVKSYIQSEQHWQKQVLHKINRQQLLNQQFTLNTFDLEKKGYIVLEDIVRFLNMETGTFYRNRDLYLIFKRISQFQKVNFNQLVDVFCTK